MEQIQETALTLFTELVGSQFMQILQDEVYGSGTFQLLMLLSFVSAMISTGFALHQGKLPGKVLFFAVALGLAAPYGGLPVGFVLVNTFANTLSAVMEKATLRFTANSGDPRTADNMHPGLVMEMLTAAATTEISDARVRNLLTKFMGKCFAGSLRRDGTPAQFDDFFDFEVSYRRNHLGYETHFRENILDERSLSGNNAFSEVEAGTSCYGGLTKLRKAMLGDLDEQPLTITEKVMAGTSGTRAERIVTTDRWLENWKRGGSPFLNTAKNLRLAMASQYEKSRLISEEGSWNNHYYKDTRMGASLRSFMLGLDSAPVDLGFAAANITELPARLTGSRWEASLGSALKELKEKLELLPYYIVTMKNTLRLICVFSILSVFTGKLQLFTTWAGSWLMVTLLPSVINATRAQHNSIILSKLGIQDFVSGAATGNKALAYGVDIGQAKALIEEFIPLAYTMINQEMKLIAFMAAMILAGSWYAGMLGNGIMGWMASSVQGYYLNQSTHNATIAAGTLAGAGSAVASNAAVRGGQNLMSFVRERDSALPSSLPHPGGSSGYSLSSVFPKEKV